MQIRLKRGTTVPLASDLVTGELAIETTTGTVYTKRDDGTIVAISGGGGGSYLPLSGGTMTGAITFDGTSGQYISKGNFDTSRGGNYGISLVCSIGYEFNWQAGWLTTTEQGSIAPRPLYLDSSSGTTLRCWDSQYLTGIEVSHTGITFPNSSLQTTAWVDAPSDGKAYSRKDAGWSTNRINDYDNGLTYSVGDQVVFSNVIYKMTNYVGAAGYDPVSYPSYWTAITGANGTGLAYKGAWDYITSYVVNDWVQSGGLPYVCIAPTTGSSPPNTMYWLPLTIQGTNGNDGNDGVDGTNGTNGLNGAMNYLDIMTITANSYGAYVSSGIWSVTYYFLNYGGMSAGWMENKCPTVYFNLYVNGVLDSTLSGSYDYYYVSGTPTTTSFNTGDHIEVKISDGTNEATINYAEFYF